MSYSCSIGFKQIAGEEIFDFMQSFKNKAIENLKGIAKDNFTFSPLFKGFTRNSKYLNDDFSIDDNTIHDLIKDTNEWARNCVFRYRFFYDKDHQLLGVYGVDKSLCDLFDNITYFQNSCDQDYEFDEWKGVKLFEEIADKWKNADDETVIAQFKKHLNSDYDPKYDSPLDYWRRSFAYNEIWKMFEWSLEDDDAVIYFSLFGSYDLVKLYDFSGFIREETENWMKKIKEKT